MPRPDITPIAPGETNNSAPVRGAFEYLLGTGSDGEINIGKPIAQEPETITISSGAITVSKGTVLLRGEGSSADTLVTINVPVGGLESESEITLRGGSPSTSADGEINEPITIDTSGNINLSGGRPFLISKHQHSITLRWAISQWWEVARSGFDGNSSAINFNLTPGSAATRNTQVSGLTLFGIYSFRCGRYSGSSGLDQSLTWMIEVPEDSPTSGKTRFRGKFAVTDGRAGSVHWTVRYAAFPKDSVISDSPTPPTTWSGVEQVTIIPTNSARRIFEIEFEFATVPEPGSTVFVRLERDDNNAADTFTEFAYLMNAILSIEP